MVTVGWAITLMCWCPSVCRRWCVCIEPCHFGPSVTWTKPSNWLLNRSAFLFFLSPGRSSTLSHVSSGQLAVFLLVYPNNPQLPIRSICLSIGRTFRSLGYHSLPVPIRALRCACSVIITCSSHTHNCTCQWLNRVSAWRIIYRESNIPFGGPMCWHWIKICLLILCLYGRIIINLDSPRIERVDHGSVYLHAGSWASVALCRV